MRSITLPAAIRLFVILMLPLLMSGCKVSDLTPERIMQIKQRHNDQIRGDDAVWASLMDRQSGFLAWLSDVRRIEPVLIHKKDWRAWVVLTREKDFGLLRGLDLEGSP